VESCEEKVEGGAIIFHGVSHVRVAYRLDYMLHHAGLKLLLAAYCTPLWDLCSSLLLSSTRCLPCLARHFQSCHDVVLNQNHILYAQTAVLQLSVTLGMQQQPAAARQGK
jgi:hypothetical protein